MTSEIGRILKQKSRILIFRGFSWLLKSSNFIFEKNIFKKSKFAISVSIFGLKMAVFVSCENAFPIYSAEPSQDYVALAVRYASSYSS